MKVALLGISAGRKNGNTDYLVQEALGAQGGRGAQVKPLSALVSFLVSFFGCWSCHAILYSDKRVHPGRLFVSSARRYLMLNKKFLDI